MSISKALELIKPFESCKLTAYLCPAKVWTIGFGATGPGIGSGLVWTQDQADNRLLTDVARFDRALKRLVKVSLTPNQHGALLSLIFNIGEGNFAASTLLRLLNSGNTAAASAQILRWDKAKGKTLKGLTRRRLAEREMFDD